MCTESRDEWSISFFLHITSITCDVVSLCLQMHRLAICRIIPFTFCHFGEGETRVLYITESLFPFHFYYFVCRCGRSANKDPIALAHTVMLYVAVHVF